MQIRTQIHESDIESLKAFEYGLVIECPLNGDPNPSDCPLHDIRLLSIKERFEWVDQLSDEQCVWYYRYHQKCYSEKLLVQRTGQV